MNDRNQQIAQIALGLYVFGLLCYGPPTAMALFHLLF